MNPASVHRWFKRALERAGLSTEWQLHDLRRAAADALYRATSDIVLAQQLLRHADVRTTRGSTCTRISKGSLMVCASSNSN
jgi:integrase